MELCRGGNVPDLREGGSILGMLFHKHWKRKQEQQGAGKTGGAPDLCEDGSEREVLKLLPGAFLLF